MKLEQFHMERMQSTWENIVRFNLSESGVHPLALGELVSDPKERDELFRLELGYGQSNGTPELRRLISAMYEGAGEENVMVTTGTAEANFLASWMLTEPGDEIIMMLPNYMQLWGLFRSFGAEAKPLHLAPDRDWAPDLDELRSAVSPRTKLIAVCNPNNPTGAILTEAEIDAIVEAARSAGAWILADEVYRGAELSGDLAPGFWGRYEKLIVTSGLSKAYGLPGLRIGWLVTTPELAAQAWAYHDYTTIGPSPASDYLARLALRPETRQSLLARTRSILNRNYPILQEWVDSRGGQFSIIPPRAGAIGYLRATLGIETLDFVERLRKDKSVLIVPGEHFLMPGYLRIGYGSNSDYLRNGLSLIDELISEIR
ncbi:MAG TPA: aminotransferase class I/II-fold pyridoxal phosphate-dependent enzyme [Blastocatellia bacterium]|nr:aminotransferase class I/II-fold pyridoxal phosphate-dependent enzyme [Blastocatellia bacterium]